jgi:hypothetical protein
MQFGKAEQDAFILDFNPTGGRGVVGRGGDGGVDGWVGGWVEVLALAVAWAPCCGLPDGAGAAWCGLHGPCGQGRWPTRAFLTLLTLRCPAPPAVLTALGAFGLVLSTFETRLFL